MKTFLCVAFGILFAALFGGCTLAAMDEDANRVSPAVQSTREMETSDRAELQVQVLKIYMISRSHTAIDLLMTNNSSNFLKHFSVAIVVSNSNGQYIGKSTAMVSYLSPASSKIAQAGFMDTQATNIHNYTISLDGVVGESGLRVDEKYKLTVK